RQVDELVGQLLEVLLPPSLEVVVPGGTTLVDQHGGQPGVLCRGSSQDVPGGHLCREEGGAVPCTDRIHRQRNGEHCVVRGNHGLPCQVQVRRAVHRDTSHRNALHRDHVHDVAPATDCPTLRLDPFRLSLDGE